MLVQDGVTGWVDAGSGGADNIDPIAAVAREAPQMGRILVNIARTGVIAPGGRMGEHLPGRGERSEVTVGE